MNSNKSFPFGAISDILQSDAEYIPILSIDEEESMNTESLPEVLPILPLRNTVLFPGVVIPITVGRDKSIQLIKDYYKKSKVIGVVTQLEGAVEDPEFKDLYSIGTVAFIHKTLQMPDGTTTVILQGKRRFSIEEPIQTDPYMLAKIKAVPREQAFTSNDSNNALFSTIKDMAIQIVHKSPNIPSEAAFAIGNIESPAFLINFISSNLNIDVAQKQKLLESDNLMAKANEVLEFLSKELQLVDLKTEIQNKVKVELDKQQRDYMLHQQIKTIQEELGDEPNKRLMAELREKASKKKWSTEVAEIFEKELSKLQRMHSAAADYSVQVNYLETLVDLPWNDYTVDNLDLDHARKILDNDHFGLEKVKERIIEYLAVLKLKNNMKSPILCLVGPPGVGKTSLGKSLAASIGRKYIRMSLGGLRDEAEIRGHRKTYIGAMPGRIIQSLKKAKSSNPVFVLDEIDKVIGTNINGDPAAALLEVLDPEQNKAFYDNFLEIEYDLSGVMFVATANTLSTIHPALRDRMEIIDISGYLLEEKIEIAKRHLVPKQMEEHGLKKSQLVFSDKVLETIIDRYTRESGVRTLEKTIAKAIRKHAILIAEAKKYKKSLSVEHLEDVLGIPLFQHEKSITNEFAGVVTGLAWTPVGGEILFIEVSLSRGEGKLSMTGSLGDVMKESAIIALEYLKAHAVEFQLDPNVFKAWNVHIHIPEGATPKDGPSAGVTMFTALLSAFSQRKVKAGLAMTGEITLRGKVLPVGGIKEKILAAKRANITHVLLPAENKKDIREIPENYISGLAIEYIDTMIQVAQSALLQEKVEAAREIVAFN